MLPMQISRATLRSRRIARLGLPESRRHTGRLESIHSIPQVDKNCHFQKIFEYFQGAYKSNMSLAHHAQLIEIVQVDSLHCASQ
jgi:hypothetical protein